MAFFFGFRSLKNLHICKKRVITFVRTHSTPIVAGTGVVVSIYSLLRRHVRASDDKEENVPVLWDHRIESTKISPRDNPQRRYPVISSISWYEKIAGIVAIVSLIIFFISHVPALPTVYATNLGWSTLILLPSSYYGRDILLCWIRDILHRADRRRKTGTRPKRIILIRHGQSIANIDSTLYQNTPDNQIPLSDFGKKQALLAGKQLRMILGDESVRFYVSPYLRSKQTWDGIIAGGNWKDYTVREEPRLREQDWGNFQDPAQMKKVDLERRRFGSFYYRPRMPNGESGADVWDRVTSVWDTLHREFDDRTSQNYVLVTHGLTIRLFLMRYFQWTVDQFNEMWNPKNCQFAVMELQVDGKYRLWTMEDWLCVEKNFAANKI